MLLVFKRCSRMITCHLIEQESCQIWTWVKRAKTHRLSWKIWARSKSMRAYKSSRPSETDTLEFELSSCLTLATWYGDTWSFHHITWSLAVQWNVYISLARDKRLYLLITKIYYYKDLSPWIKRLSIELLRRLFLAFQRELPCPVSFAFIPAPRSPQSPVYSSVYFIRQNSRTPMGQNTQIRLFYFLRLIKLLDFGFFSPINKPRRHLNVQ